MQLARSLVCTLTQATIKQSRKRGYETQIRHGDARFSKSVIS